METERPLRVGIVGCGHAAEVWHIPALRKTKDVKLAAVCDINESLAKKTAERIHTNRYYADLSEMLTEEKLDILHICTPPSTHAALSIKAMEAGLHVLVEKPMALSTKDTDEMIKASQSNHVKLCVVHNALFMPVILKAKSMISNGELGEVTGISIKDSWPKDNPYLRNKDHWYHKLPCGVFGEMLPHPIYLARAFIGLAEPEAVYARKFSSFEWVAADELRVILNGKKGIGTLTESCNWSKDSMLLDIFGTRMNLYVNLNGGILVKYNSIGGESRAGHALDSVSQGYQLLSHTAYAAANVLLGRQRNGHFILIEKFVEAVKNDAEPPVTGEEGKEVVRILEKLDAMMRNSLGKS